MLKFVILIFRSKFVENIEHLTDPNFREMTSVRRPMIRNSLMKTAKVHGFAHHICFKSQVGRS